MFFGYFQIQLYFWVDLNVILQFCLDPKLDHISEILYFWDDYIFLFAVDELGQEVG